MAWQQQQQQLSSSCQMIDAPVSCMVMDRSFSRWFSSED